MRVAVIASRHDPDIGYVGEYLSGIGATLTRYWRSRTETLADAADGNDLIVLMGSGWSISDPQWKKEVEAESALVGRALRRDMPIFAICYGAQVVASVLGATISRCPRPEIGWVSVDTNDPSACPSGPWFEFHQYRWGDIPNVAPIAVSDLAPQAFRYRRTLAVQFHPEATVVAIERWLETAPHEAEAGGIDLGEVLSRSREFAAASRDRAHVLLEDYLETIAGQ